MSVFAPPARQGDFLYSSVLYADPGNANHHPRASVAELAALLRPEAPNIYSKGRKPEASTPAKDPPWHYYSAQLIHYGLPVTKDKNGAKVRLLNAMNQFKLEVPAWVSKMEGDLKKEWEAENRKMKKSGGAGVASKDPVAGKGKGKATKSAKGDVNVTGKWKVVVVAVASANEVVVNVSLSGLSMVEQLGMQHTQGAAPKKPSPTKRKRADSDPPAKATKATKAKPVSTPAKKAKQEPKPATKVKKESTPATKLKKELVSKPTTSCIKQEHSPPFPQREIRLSGIYEVDCPTASDIFNSFDLDLTLAVDTPRSTWWATFRWGAWVGIIKMNPGPTYDALNKPCSLGWRLRDLETGQLRFGKKCMGTMTFFEDQTFTGELYDVPDAGTVEFEGRRLAGPRVEDDLQDEWDGFVSEAYGR
jgi:hypothetical protein